MKTRVAAIEFGTSKIVTVIAQSSTRSNHCQIVSCGKVNYAGYGSGDWTDWDSLNKAIYNSIIAAQSDAGTPIKDIYIGVPCEKPKPITCKLFYAKIVSMLNWNPDDRHKLLGRLIHANGEYLLAFDLAAPETYPKVVVEGEKPRRSRRPIYPADWQDQFGLPYYEHRQSMQINIFDGYAVYAIKEEGNAPQASLLTQSTFENSSETEENSHD